MSAIAARACCGAPTPSAKASPPICYPMRWHDSTIALSELGAKVFVEMPPGQTLTQLAAEVLPDAASIAMDASSVASVAVRVRAACRRAKD
jgi:malonate decarboxylase epsilon subunit